ncbi:hypothetical protein BT93_H2348 [Corymbia citriodora subsp. variegata]|nr:hypothetical protein BT93_H2348 [Corymbia citriodora subsp. variegata]KAF8017106.1 hypothetical protein BT93_H2348 [Corymbia citriodora subsp. variegata]KAF8017110.1 hypothetical protein BT93_H2348 [Corymbia citriodora subsp. variegata]KAF8017116.1 hypothetical protein BT93_H2348 [Corymbia citriodora subsp. variegata]
MPISRNSNKLIQKWSASSSLDGGSQITEELERKIGLMEASLSRFGIVVDSVQSDVMQVNKRTKEISLEVESIHQKLITQDNSLQQMSKGQEDIKASLDGCFKSISEQLNKHKNEDRLQEVFSALSALPEKVEELMLKLQDQLQNTFTKEMQAARHILWDQESAAPAVLPVKVRVDERECRLTIESDEEIDSGFPCLLDDREMDRGSSITDEVKVETARILRKARKRKWRSSKTIVIN